MSLRDQSVPSRWLGRRAAGAVALLALAVPGCGGTATPDDPTSAPSPADTSPSASPSAHATPTTLPTPTPASYQLGRLRPAAYDGWLTEVPDGLRVDGRLPEGGGDFTRSRHGVAFAFCDEEAFPTGESLDRATASAAGPEYGETRDLRVFVDDRAADRFQRDVIAVVAACPEPEMDGSTWRNELRDSHLDGDASFTAVQSFFTYDDRPVLGATFWEVVRVGNAVLVTSTGGEYDPTTTLDPGIRDHAGDVAQIVEEMCVFGTDPCDRPPADGTSTK